MKKFGNLESGSFGCNMLCQAAGDDHGEWSKNKKHVWHKKTVHMEGPYGEADVEVECLYCTDRDHWAYVYPTGGGYGYADWDGDYGYGYDYGDDPYSDPYGDVYYYTNEYEQKETIRITTVPDPGEVKNGYCDLGIMAAQLDCTMGELWDLINKALWEKYPMSDDDYYGHTPLPSGMYGGIYYYSMSFVGQEIWIELQKGSYPYEYTDESGYQQTGVQGIKSDMLSLVSAMIGAPGTSNIPFNSSNQDDVMSAIDSDRPYYTSYIYDRTETEDLVHSVAIVGYTKGVITGKIYTYIMKDFVSGMEYEISADDI